MVDGLQEPSNGSRATVALLQELLTPTLPELAHAEVLPQLLEYLVLAESQSLSQLLLVDQLLSTSKLMAPSCHTEVVSSMEPADSTITQSLQSAGVAQVELNTISSETLGALAGVRAVTSE